MSGIWILIAVLAIPYIALNVRRLLQGRSWAFTFCQAAKEWEERDRAKRRAARIAELGLPVASGRSAGDTDAAGTARG